MRPFRRPNALIAFWSSSRTSTSSSDCFGGMRAEERRHGRAFTFTPNCGLWGGSGTENACRPQPRRPPRHRRRTAWAHAATTPLHIESQRERRSPAGASPRRGSSLKWCTSPGRPRARPIAGPARAPRDAPAPSARPTRRLPPSTEERTYGTYYDAECMPAVRGAGTDLRGAGGGEAAAWRTTRAAAGRPDAHARRARPARWRGVDGASLHHQRIRSDARIHFANAWTARPAATLAARLLPSGFAYVAASACLGCSCPARFDQPVVSQRARRPRASSRSRRAAELLQLIQVHFAGKSFARRSRRRASSRADLPGDAPRLRGGGAGDRGSTGEAPSIAQRARLVLSNFARLGSWYLGNPKSRCRCIHRATPTATGAWWW